MQVLILVNIYKGCIKSCVGHWRPFCRAWEGNTQNCDADVTHRLSCLHAEFCIPCICVSVWCCLMMVALLLKMCAVAVCVCYYWFATAVYANSQWSIKGWLQSLWCSCLLHPFFGIGTSTYIVMYNSMKLDVVSVLQAIYACYCGIMLLNYWINDWSWKRLSLHVDAI